MDRGEDTQEVMKEESTEEKKVTGLKAEQG